MAMNVFRLMAEINSPEIKLIVKARDGMVRIEGSRKSLRWLSQVIQAYSDQRFEDDFWIKPKGPGSVYFAKSATHGIYLLNSDTLKKSSLSKPRKAKPTAKRRSL